MRTLTRGGEARRAPGRGGVAPDDNYKWVALANTTAGVFMSALDGSIVIIALPAIFRGIHLDPLAPGNVSYVLWMIMGYRLLQAVIVVTVGRLGDIYGRVRIYNAGFVVFAFASVMLSFDPFDAGAGAEWLIGWRVFQALGGAMLMANSAAILTDAFPREERGFALGINQVAAIAGQFVGLVAGGLLAALDWRAVFWVNVPVGIYGTIWAYRKLRDTGVRHRAPIDWWGNVTFAVGLAALLIAITQGIQPYQGHAMGWTNPAVIGLLVAGIGLLGAFFVIERRVSDPLFQLSLFRIRAFSAGNVAGFAVSIARGGLQFMLVIWLQGIWLPLHGYDYSDTPFWAGIFLLPLTAGILVSGPLAGRLSDRHGARGMATSGMLVFAASFLGLMALPVDFPYWAFALLIAANGVGGGMFAAPNSASVMSSVPSGQRGAASGIRATFQNSGTALSIGVFFSLMIAGLASSLPSSLTSALTQQGVSHAAAAQVATIPPVASLFAAMLGVNPLQHLLAPTGALTTLPASAQHTITGTHFFPQLIADPFHQGLEIVFLVAAGLALLAAVASLMRGPRMISTAEVVADPEDAVALVMD
ncbi:MAG TPA: MFS transporter [Candidatus Dormibacteraeota bacterium]|nr:MFS transporter [Candidatus Dormibacteraeota bacterium]